MKLSIALPLAAALLALTACSGVADAAPAPVITPTPESSVSVPPSKHEIHITGEFEDDFPKAPSDFTAQDLYILREGVDPNALTREELDYLWMVQELMNDAVKFNIEAREGQK